MCIVAQTKHQRNALHFSLKNIKRKKLINNDIGMIFGVLDTGDLNLGKFNLQLL